MLLTLSVRGGVCVVRTAKPPGGTDAQGQGAPLGQALTCCTSRSYRKSVWKWLAMVQARSAWDLLHVTVRLGATNFSGRETRAETTAIGRRSTRQDGRLQGVRPRTSPPRGPSGSFRARIPPPEGPHSPMFAKSVTRSEQSTRASRLLPLTTKRYWSLGNLDTSPKWHRTWVPRSSVS